MNEGFIDFNKEAASGTQYSSTFSWGVESNASKGGWLAQKKQAARNKMGMDAVDVDHIAIAFDGDFEPVLCAHPGDKDPFGNHAMLYASLDATAQPGQRASETVTFDLSLLREEQIGVIVTAVVSRGFGKLSEMRYELFDTTNGGNKRTLMDRRSIAESATACLLGKFKRDPHTGLWTQALVKDRFTLATDNWREIAQAAQSAARR